MRSWHCHTFQKIPISPLLVPCLQRYLINSHIHAALLVLRLCLIYVQRSHAVSPVQRVYGVTFPDKEGMADYKMRMEEAKKRDHRMQGTKQELFFFDRMSPGSCFFLPNGGRIYNSLVEVHALSASIIFALARLDDSEPGNGFRIDRSAYSQ